MAAETALPATLNDSQTATKFMAPKKNLFKCRIAKGLIASSLKTTIRKMLCHLPPICLAVNAAAIFQASSPNDCKGTRGKATKVPIMVANEPSRKALSNGPVNDITRDIFESKRSIGTAMVTRYRLTKSSFVIEQLLRVWK